jgi:hypothetical protein
MYKKQTKKLLLVIEEKSSSSNDKFLKGALVAGTTVLGEAGSYLFKKKDEVREFGTHESGRQERAEEKKNVTIQKIESEEFVVDKQDVKKGMPKTNNSCIKLTKIYIVDEKSGSSSGSFFKGAFVSGTTVLGEAGSYLSKKKDEVREFGIRESSRQGRVEETKDVSIQKTKSEQETVVAEKEVKKGRRNKITLVKN